jgi:hypothetical protein
MTSCVGAWTVAGRVTEVTIGLCAGRPAWASSGTATAATAAHTHGGASYRKPIAPTTLAAQAVRMNSRAVRVSFPALWIRRWSDSPSAAACRSSLARSEP